MLLFNKHFRRPKARFLYRAKSKRNKVDLNGFRPFFQYMKERAKSYFDPQSICEKNAQGDRLDPSRCEFFLPFKVGRDTLKIACISTHRHNPCDIEICLVRFLHDTRNPLKKEETGKRYCRELAQTTIVSEVPMTLSLSTFLLNSLVGRSLRAPQIVS